MQTLDYLDSVLQLLDELDEQTDTGADNSDRQHERSPFRKEVTMLVPQSKGTPKSEFNLRINDRPVVIKTWSRNISRGGFGFIYLAQIVKPRLYFCLESPDWGRALFGAEVVRSRAIRGGFWEYGVKFRSRLMLPGHDERAASSRCETDSVEPDASQSQDRWSKPQVSPLYLPNQAGESEPPADAVDASPAIFVG